MSASLVGSEMCIRDSGWPRLARGWLVVGWRLAGGCPVVVRRWLGREPVSYTHLTLPTICSV
eukprot:12800434-Alexandrium_andersonii.AAC.1